MKKLLLVLIVATCCIALDAAGAHPAGSGAQSKISKAYATVEPVPGEPRVLVRITNLANVALEAWEVVVVDNRDGSPRPIIHFTADTALNPNVNRAEGSEPFLRGPIAPGETRDRRFPLSEVPAGPSVEIRMLLFEDLSSEGSAEEVARVLAARERYARSLQMWSEALQTASGMAPHQAKTHLHEILSAEERHADPSDGFARAMRLGIAELIASPDTRLSERIAALKRHLAWQRERALRHTVR